MPLDLTDTYFETDLDAVLRFQELMLQAVEGARHAELDHEYGVLRKMLLADPTYKDAIPTFVRRNRDLGSLWPALKSFSPQWEPRRVEVRRQFEPALEIAERAELFGVTETHPPGYNSSAWTGAATPTERVVAVKTLIPIALNAVDHLIALLEAPGHNGGPPLDGTTDAIENLRALHAALGQLLVEADEGNLTDVSHSGFSIEAARYGKRAAKALRDDPIPYAFSGTILAIMAACGLPGIGGWLASVAMTMKKK